jgi:hypothetical protein
MVDWRELLKALLETFPEIMRGGRMDKILRDPEAVSGPLQPQQLGQPVGDSLTMSPLLQQLLSQRGGAPLE